MDPADLEREFRGLAQRVQAIEDRLGISPAGAAVPGEPTPAATPASESSDFLPALGRTLLALAGAYLLRAVTGADIIPVTAGVVIGILYAIAWLLWAAHTPAERRVEAALHSLTAVLVLAPLLWEATLRFHALSPWAAALTLLFFTLFGLAVSWRKNLLIVATISTVAGLGTAAALLVATRSILPFTFVFLATAAAVEASACLDHWLAERWLAAAVADLGVLLATWLVTNPRGLPEGYDPIPHGWLVAAQVALLAVYLSSTIVRTLFRHFTFTAFETAQCAVAFGIVVGGGLQLWPAMLICGAACYVVAFAALAHGRNFYTYSTFGILLVLAGSRLVLAGPAAATVWAVLAVACAWSGRRTLQVHGAIYLLLALATHDALTHAVTGLVLAAVCYWGAARGPLRIPLFGVVVWLSANLAAAAIPSAALAVKLLVFGAALIALPRIRANRGASPAGSETTPRPHDSAAKSDTASGAV